MSLSKHGAEAIKAAEEGRPQKSDFKRQNIFFDWGNQLKHTIRLVGEFKSVRSHWIGKSAFGGEDVPLFKDGAFKGEDKLPARVNCSNWDSSTESSDADGGCVICRIAANASKYLEKEGKHLDEDTRKWLQDLQFKCAPANSFYFLCIDRGNPYIAEGEKGFKIIQMSTPLLKAIIAIDEDLGGTDICSDEEGIDIVIKKTLPVGKSKRTEYSASPAFDKTSVKQTPLTEEEKSWNRIDLAKFTGKKPDEEMLVSLLRDNVKEVWNEETPGSEEDENDAPF